MRKLVRLVVLSAAIVLAIVLISHMDRPEHTRIPVVRQARGIPAYEYRVTNEPDTSDIVHKRQQVVQVCKSYS